jgi:hypothetical protein
VSSGPNPEGSCAAIPSGFETAAKAETGLADSRKRKSAKRLTETVARTGERDFMARTPK